MAKKVKTEIDGGYYAIKGFLYQFDKNLLEILQNKTVQVEIENIQDISFEKYVIQVKHKETAVYYDSSVKRPITQLIELFVQDSGRNLILYCHFSDKKPEQKKLTLLELNDILGKDCNAFSQEIKEGFISNFTLQFSENYLVQFDKLIENIQTAFSCSDKELAIMYHSILHSKLMQIAILPNKVDRVIDFEKLKSYLNSVDKTIYFKAYEFYNTKERYEKLIKKEFFTSNDINIKNYQRLFIIEVTNSFNCSDLVNIVNKLEKKYYKKDKSVAPFIMFQNLNETDLINLQIDLSDKQIEFSDGTLFNGDKFRINILTTQNKTKIIHSENLEEVFNNTKFDEVFYLASNFDNAFVFKNKFVKIQISEHQQLLKIL